MTAKNDSGATRVEITQDMVNRAVIASSAADGHCRDGLSCTHTDCHYRVILEAACLPEMQALAVDANTRRWVLVGAVELLRQGDDAGAAALLLTWHFDESQRRR